MKDNKHERIWYTYGFAVEYSRTDDKKCDAAAYLDI